MTEILLVFIATAGLDFVWSRYTNALVVGSPAAASNWAVGITVLSGLITAAFVKDLWLLIPAGAGAWAGTYASKMKWFPRRPDGGDTFYDDDFFKVPAIVMNPDGSITTEKGATNVR